MRLAAGRSQPPAQAAVPANQPGSCSHRPGLSRERELGCPSVLGQENCCSQLGAFETPLREQHHDFLVSVQGRAVAGSGAQGGWGNRRSGLTAGHRDRLGTSLHHPAVISAKVSTPTGRAQRCILPARRPGAPRFHLHGIRSPTGHHVLQRRAAALKPRIWPVSLAQPWGALDIAAANGPPPWRMSLVSVRLGVGSDRHRFDPRISPVPSRARPPGADQAGQGIKGSGCARTRHPSVRSVEPEVGGASPRSRLEQASARDPAARGCVDSLGCRCWPGGEQGWRECAVGARPLR